MRTKKNTIFLAFLSFLLTGIYIPGVHAQVLQNLNPFKKAGEDPKYAFSSEDVTTMKNDIINLSSYKMKGRLMSTQGEKEAANYIASRFRQIGLQEVDKNYQRKFSYSEGQTISGESFIAINNAMIKVPVEAYPVSFSGNKYETNYIISGSNEANNIWILPAFKSAQDAKKSNEEKEAILYKLALNAKERGASGIIFYNNFGKDFILPFQYKTAFEEIGIPVYEVSQEIYDKHLANAKKLTAVRLEPMVKPLVKEGINVFGVINNYAKKTVIISANYDGFINDSGDPVNPNALPGANDNASGIAAILAIAQKLRTAKSNFNYLIIAYSGRNKGLMGSAKFLADKTFSRDKISHAIHFDKIGRIDRQNNVYVAGVGTYPGWKAFFSEVDKNLSFVVSNRGMDSSDYQNYYRNNIAFLNFSTGSDQEAGSAGDNVAKINMNGIAGIADKALKIITELDIKNAAVTFNPALDVVENPGNAEQPKLQVSLGISPDLAYKAGGILINKVAKDKDGDNAGLMEGDIIVQIRNFPIQTYDDYLEALRKFKKGDRVYIKVKRKSNLIQKVVTFS